MIDFRLSTGYFEHPKTIKLERRLGDSGVLSHIRLLRFCASNPTRWDGNLLGMSAEDIAIAAGWKGDEEDFVKALLECRLLDKIPEGLVIHDWADHNTYVADGIERSEKAKKAANKRWAKHRAEASKADAPLVDHTKDAQALQNDAEAKSSNAPYPEPYPVPEPEPTPTMREGAHEAVGGGSPTPDHSDHPDQPLATLHDLWCSLRGIVSAKPRDLEAMRKALELPGATLSLVLSVVTDGYRAAEDRGDPPTVFRYFLPGLERELQRRKLMAAPVQERPPERSDGGFWDPNSPNFMKVS